MMRAFLGFPILANRGRMRLAGMMRSVPPLWLLVLLALALWGGEFARRGLWEPDEARYAYVAREMHQDGNWFVLHINGEPYPDKPPLMFWLTNVSSVLTGGRINGVSARLPSLLGSLLTLWVVTRLLARWHSTQAAWRGMLVLLTTFLFWQEGGWGRIDALLCGLVMASVYFLLASLEERRVLRELVAYLFAGLAVLAKGPIGLVLPMGIFLAWSAAGGYGRKLKRSHWLWGPLVAITLPSLWLLVAWYQGAPPDYFAAMFGEKSFGRVLESTGHNRPFYYFLLHFPLEFLPWTIFLPAAIASLSDRALKRMLLAWLGFVIGLFSLFVCKRNVYILAAYPAAAMLIAAAWNDIPNLPRRWSRATAVVAMGLVWVLAAAVSVALFVPQVHLNRLLLIPSALILLSGGTLLVRLYRREQLGMRWFLAFCGVFFLFQISVTAVVLPGLNSVKGPVEAAREIRARLPVGQPVYLFQQQLAIIPLYAERQGREIQGVEDLEKIVAGQPCTIVVFNQTQWRELQPRLGGSEIAHPFRMGNKRLLWVELPQAGRR